MPRVLLLANFDSSLKLAGRIAEAVAAAGGEPDIRVPTTTAPHGLGERQIRAATARPVRFGTWQELVAEGGRAEAVVPVFDGPNVERFIRDLHHLVGDRMPAVGAGYVGMALYDLVGGYLMRSLADVVAVNSRSDLADFTRGAAALGLPTDNLLLAGLALLPATPAPLADGPVRTVLFADQPTVPRTRLQRVELWDRLIGYAELHPDRRVLLRPRHRPGEDTFHRMRFSPEAWAATRTMPANLAIVHDPIDTLIESTDLLLTVSSTAALEAVAAGVRVAFVADSVNDANLNPRLLGSGLLRTFDDIDADRLGVPDTTWIDDVFPAAHGPAPADRFATRLLEVAADPAMRTHRAMWDSPFHSGRRSTDDRLLALAEAPAARYTPRRVAAGVLRRALRTVEG